MKLDHIISGIVSTATVNGHKMRIVTRWILLKEAEGDRRRKNALGVLGDVWD